MSNGRITQLTTDAPKPSAHSSHATLIAELAAERAKVKKLREALEGWLAWIDRPTLDADEPLRRITYKAHESRIDASRAALAETAE